MLEHSAQAAFPGVSAQILRRLEKTLGVGPTPPGERITKPHNLHRLIAAALGGDGDAALLALEQACGASAPVLSEVLGAEGALDGLDSRDRQEVEAYVKSSGKAQLHEAAAEVQAFLQQEKAKRRRAAKGHQPEAAAPASPPLGGGGGAAGQEPVAEEPAENQRKHWRAAASGAADLAGHVVQGFMPPTFKVYEDHMQGRFRGTCSGVLKEQKSFSWSTRGREEAASLLLRWAWNTRAQHTGAASGAELCPHIGIFTGGP